MNVVEYELSRSVRFHTLVEPEKPLLFGWALARAFQEKYNFLQGPMLVEEYDIERGVTFLRGSFGDDATIERFQFFSNGMLAESKSDTDVCDAFLDEVGRWAEQATGAKLNESFEGGRAYLSQIVVHAPMPLADKFAPLASLGERIGTLASSYTGMKNIPATFTGFQVQTDPGTRGGWLYRFERRATAPLDMSLYFSSAPLRTRDHLQVLDDVAAALTS